MDGSNIHRGGGYAMAAPEKIDRASEHAKSRRGLSYRVIVHDIRSGFDRPAVLQSVTHLFPCDVVRSIDASGGMPEGVPIARSMRDASGATRLAELLTQAGCRCSIEISVVTPRRAKSRRRALATPDSWYQRLDARLARVPANLTAFMQSAATLWHRTRAVLRSTVHHPFAQWVKSAWMRSDRMVADIRASAADPLRSVASRAALFWTPRLQQFVFGLGALATIGVLSSAIPGYSVSVGGSDTDAQPTRRDHRPLAPVLDLDQSMRVANMGSRRGVEQPADGLHRAVTSLGAITLERVPLNPHLWVLKWDGSTLRELRVESTPSIVSRQGGDRLEAAIGEFGDEVALVVDTGEPRSLFCQANKTLLVVLSKVGAAHLHDIPGNCVELESVAVVGGKLLMHFYDRAAPSVAYEAGQILRIGR